jgi:anaerobic ribonucleoside-triphosphate reductase activating protein
MLLHALIPASHANGPGLRAVVFFQGCTLACPGCWNSATHHFHSAEVTVGAVTEEVLRAHKKHTLEGVTFSGGEPMQQAGSLLALVQLLRPRIPGLSFGMFSGYNERELDGGRYSVWGRELETAEKCSLWQAIRAALDFAVLGRFNHRLPSAAPLRSSRNQVLRLFSNRYTRADFAEQVTEVQITETGTAEVTGFPILGLPW